MVIFLTSSDSRNALKSSGDDVDVRRDGKTMHDNEIKLSTVMCNSRKCLYITHSALILTLISITHEFFHINFVFVFFGQDEKNKM